MVKDKISFPVECTFKSGETENSHKIKFKIFICDIKVTKQSEGIRNVVRHYFKYSGEIKSFFRRHSNQNFNKVREELSRY